jgi:hypothetical protein
VVEARSPVIRDDLAAARERAWNRLSSPGTWWSASERLAIVDEARRATQCGLCRRRKEALSPYTIDGVHDSCGVLPKNVVEVIHRIRTDSGRLRKAWFDEAMASGLTDAAYVEIVGVIATSIGLDTFDRALRLPRRLLPTAKPGEPTRHRPKGARKTIAWVATLAQEDIAEQDPDPYPGFEPVNVHLAMSLVPEEVAGFFELDQALYLPQAAIRDLDNEYRALTHSQLELIAARMAALNRCFY